MAWQIEFADSARKQLGKLGRAEAKRITAFPRERVGEADDPRRLAKQLKGSESIWRFRVGDYRILATIEDKRITVLVLGIGHRREVDR